MGDLPTERCCGQWNKVNCIRRPKLSWVSCGLQAGHSVLPFQPLFQACCQIPFLWKRILMQFSCHADELTAQTNGGLTDCGLKELVTNMQLLVQPGSYEHYYPYFTSVQY